MRSLVVRFAAPRIIELHDVDLPKPRAGELLIRTLFSGISSGTEMLAYRGEVDPSLPLDETIGALGGTFEYPFEYGYSAVGVVESGGEEIEAGSLVFSFQPHRSWFTARPEDLIRVSDLDPRRATMFPLIETALQISLDAGPLEDQDVVVVGLGPVGMLAAMLIQRSGARVIGVEPVESRRGLAGELGLTAVSPERAEAAVEAATDGSGAAAVVEVSGNPTALADSLRLLAREGIALVCSWFGTKMVPLPLGAEFHRRRLTIKSSQVSTIPSHLSAEWSLERRREIALDLMHQLPLERLATHTFDVEQAPDAFEKIESGLDGMMHAAFRYAESD